MMLDFLIFALLGFWPFWNSVLPVIELDFLFFALLCFLPFWNSVLPVIELDFQFFALLWFLPFWNSVLPVIELDFQFFALLCFFAFLDLCFVLFLKEINQVFVCTLVCNWVLTVRKPNRKSKSRKSFIAQTYFDHMTIMLH